MARRSITRGGALALSFAGALGLAAAGGARAQEHRVELSIEHGAPAWLGSCLSEDKLNASYRAAHAAGGTEVSTSPAAVGVRAVEHEGRAATLEIQARSAHEDLGSRVLSVHANDCGAVPDAVALVLLLLSRSATTAPAPRPEPASAPAPAPPAFDPERAPFLTPPQPVEESPLQPRAAAVVSLVWGVLPQTAFALALDGELGSTPWAVRVRAQLLWPQTRRVAEGTVTLLAFGLGADGCLGSTLPGLSWFELRACAGPRASLIHAAGRGFRLQNRAPLEPALHLGTTLEATVALSGTTWLRLHLDGAVALVRPRFVVEIQDLPEPSEVAAPGLLRGETGVSVVQIF